MFNTKLARHESHHSSQGHHIEKPTGPPICNAQLNEAAWSQLAESSELPSAGEAVRLNNAYLDEQLSFKVEE
jgi:hypothetical protein